MAIDGAVAVKIWHSPAQHRRSRHRAMKHASPAALDQLTQLLARVRQFERVKEKSRGVFYCRSKAFLHFHEDPAGLFADLRTGSDWQLFRINSQEQQATLLLRIRLHLARSSVNHGA
jgi:hypothetical protein